MQYAADASAIGLAPTLGLLLFVAVVVAMVTRRLRVPYSVGLVVAGAGIALATR